MNNFTTLITDFLANYDKNMKEQDKLLKNTAYFKIREIDDNTENDKIIFYDYNHNQIIQFDFQIIGIYKSDFNSWTWAWGIPGLNSKLTRIITKILNYGFTLDPKKQYHLKSEIINSRFIISDPIQIDIHLAITSGISKINNIYPIIIPINKTEKQEISFVKNNEIYTIIKTLDDIKENEDVKINYIFLFNPVKK